ncbi:MAG: translocation/assembly module TamB domain-containing protein [Gammaproteobacteria bacterium]|nr:translocation/assembly module TamB domain-containing protein [Gammaproteobacteria bacterium]
MSALLRLLALLAMLMVSTVFVGFVTVISPFGLQLATKLAPRFNYQIENASGTLTQGSIGSISGPEADIEGLSLKWHASCLFQLTLCVEHIHIDAITLRLPASTEQTTEDQPLDFSLPELPIDVAVQSLSIDKLTLIQETPVVIGPIALGAQWVDQVIQIPVLRGQMQDNAIDGRLSVDGRPKTPMLNADLDIRYHIDDSIKGVLGAQLRGNLRELAFSYLADGYVHSSGFGRYDLPSGRLTLESEVGEFALPEAELNLKQAKLKLEGVLPQAELSLYASGDVAQLGAVEARIEVRTQDLAVWHIDNSLIKALGGSVSLQGEVAVQGSDIRADASLELAQINVQALLPDIASNLNGSIRAQYVQTEQSQALPALDTQIYGQWMGYPAKVDLQASSADLATIDIAKLELSSGDNALNASGSASMQAVDLTSEFELQSLVQLLPGARGQISGKMHAVGATLTPKVDATIKASNVGYQQLVALQRLDARISADMQSGMTIDTELDARQLKLDGRVIDSAKLSLAGNQDSHQLALQLASDLGDIDTKLSGGLDIDTLKWHGDLNALSARIEDIRLALNKPANLAIDGQAQTATLDDACLDIKQSNLCINQAVLGTSGEVSASLNRLNLDDAKPYLPEGLTITGIIDGRLAAKWTDLNLDTLDTALNSNNIRIDHPALNGQRLEITQLAATVDGNLDNLTQAITLRTARFGTLDTNGTIGLNAKRIESTLNLSGLELSALRTLVPDLKQLGGATSAALAIKGPWNNPQVNGTISATNLLAEVYNLPYRVDGGNGVINLIGNQSNGGFDLNTNVGRLRLDLDATLPNRLAANLRSERLEIPVDGIGKVSALADLNLLWQPSGTNVTGSINIPKASIKPTTLPSSAPVRSGDVVFVDGLSSRGDQASRATPLGLDVDVIVGEEVAIEAYGLKAKVKGAIKAQAAKGQAIGLYGNLQLNEASYRAYGQNLRVDRGNIILAGSPGRGRLSLDAYRDDLDEVEAGIKVSGPFQSPALKLISNPPMRDSEVLSYIVSGRSFGDVTGENSMSALASMLLNGALQNQGNDKLAVNASGQGENTTVGLESQVSDKLSVKYDLGLFKPIHTLTLRYELGKQTYLEFVRGLDTAVDLFYAFELYQ